MSNVRSLLDELAQNHQNQLALVAGLTQRQTEAGEKAFKAGKTYTPTIADLQTLVNDDPNNRIDPQVGIDAQNLQQDQGRLLLAIEHAQKAAGVAPNKGPEIMKAAQSGDYSAIRGA